MIWEATDVCEPLHDDCDGEPVGAERLQLQAEQGDGGGGGGEGGEGMRPDARVQLVHEQGEVLGGRQVGGGGEQAREVGEQQRVELKHTKGINNINKT